jgi:tRNA A-37 threonylcarbamoyl transferase component Bud32
MAAPPEESRSNRFGHLPPSEPSNAQPAAAPTKLVRARRAGYAIPGFSRACLLRLIDYPELPLRSRAREVIKAGNSALVVKVELSVGERLTSVAYKRVRRKNWLKRISVFLRTNRTLRTWKLGHELLRRGIDTARPLAVIVPHRFDLAGPSYVAHEWIAGGTNLRDWSWHVARLGPETCACLQRTTAASLGILLGQMHRQNVGHRDLKPGNLLLVEERNGVRACVIDLDGVSLYNRISRRLRLRNLSRLVVGTNELPRLPRTVYLRFLLAYLSAAGDRSGWKDFWRSLQSLSAVREERKRRKAA